MLIRNETDHNFSFYREKTTHLKILIEGYVVFLYLYNRLVHLINHNFLFHAHKTINKWEYKLSFS